MRNLYSRDSVLCFVRTIVDSNNILSFDGFYFLRRFVRLDVRIVNSADNHRRGRRLSTPFRKPSHRTASLLCIGNRHNAFAAEYTSYTSQIKRPTPKNYDEDDRSLLRCYNRVQRRFLPNTILFNYNYYYWTRLMRTATPSSAAVKQNNIHEYDGRRRKT